MCLAATMQPLSSAISPAGPTILRPGVLAKSPEFLTTGGTPKVKASVIDIST